MTEIEYLKLSPGDTIVYHHKKDLKLSSYLTEEKEYVVLCYYNASGSTHISKMTASTKPYGIQIRDDNKQILMVCSDNVEKYFTLKENDEIPEEKKVEVSQVTPWINALNAARRTIGKKPISKDKPSKKWEAQSILAEHSPIRLVWWHWTWNGIKTWIAGHFVRHHEGVEKFVHSQRDDRRDNGIPRDELPQGSLNDMEMEGNIQALINISRKRVCNNAHKETREAWKLVLDEIEKQDPILGEKLKLGRECVYRGFCPEFKCCGYCNTEQYQKDLIKYRNTDYNE